MTTPFNWFDIVAMILIGLGIWMGRRRGMSAELLHLLLWLGIVILAAQFNPFLGPWLAGMVGFSPTVSFVLAYMLVALGVFFLIYLVRRWQGEKLVSGDAFGSFEYYLGMIGGVIHVLCILVAVMAILHAPRVSDAQLQQQLKSQQEWAGSIYFPPFGQIQRSIFDGSITGRLVTEYLSTLLINVDPNVARASSDNIYRARERLVDEAGRAR
jgi:uncharacterized membrane protein required for colicin V production